MMDTLSQVASQKYSGLAPSLPPLPLARIEICADRVEQLAYNIEQYVSRFHNGPNEQSDGAACRQVPRGYNGEIERLAEAIDRLDNATQSLSQIG